MKQNRIDHKKVYGAGYNAGVKASGGGAKGARFSRTAAEMMLCWNPGTAEVRLVEFPDKYNKSGNYTRTTLACWDYVQNATHEQRKTIVFIEAMHLIVRDRCDPIAVHKALLELQEYRDGCAIDMPYL